MLIKSTVSFGVLFEVSITIYSSFLVSQKYIEILDSNFNDLSKINLQ